MLIVSAKLLAPDTRDGALCTHDFISVPRVRGRLRLTDQHGNVACPDCLVAHLLAGRAQLATHTPPGELTYAEQNVWQGLCDAENNAGEAAISAWLAVAEPVVRRGGPGAELLVRFLRAALPAPVEPVTEPALATPRRPHRRTVPVAG